MDCGKLQSLSPLLEEPWHMEGDLDASAVQNARGAEIKHPLVEGEAQTSGGASQSHSMQIIKQMVSQKCCQEKASQFHHHGDSSSNKKNLNVNLKIASFG